MTNEQFERIVSHYHGTLITDNGNLVFKARNDLNGTKVECVVELQGATLNAWETTYSIIGGVGIPNATEDDLNRVLKKYNFKQKEWVQMALF